MGSLSLFILHDSVKQALDDAFSKALQAGRWGDYLEDCHYYLLKAKQESAPISYDGAFQVMQFYFNQVISTTDNDSLVVKCVSVLQQVVEMCSARSPMGDQVWHNKLAESTLPLHLLKPCILHWQRDVRVFGAQQVYEVIENVGPKTVLGCEGLTVAVIKLLDKGLTRDSSEAKKILVALSVSSEGLSTLFSESESQDAFKRVAASSDMARFNVYEVVQRVAVKGLENLSVVSNSGWLDQITNEARSDDVLNRLAALQLITDMVEDDRTLQHLSKAGVLGSLQNALVEAQNEDDPNSAMTLPGLLKLFGGMGHKHPELLIHQHGPALNAIFHLTQSRDNSMMLIAVENIAHVASTCSGKQLMQSFHKAEVHRVLKDVGERIHNAPVEIRDRLLCATTIFFKSSDSSQDRVENDEVTEILQVWYSTLFPCKSIAPIFRLLKLPFSDFRPYVYRLLLELGKSTWGLKLIASSEPLLEFIINRNSESNKEGKELKFELIKQLLAQKEVVSEVCLDATIIKLQEYRGQGPFYVQPFNDEMDMMGVSR